MTELKLEPFGKMPDGRNIDLYTLTNEHGTRVAVTTYGARLVRFEKDVQGHPVDIVLGYTRGEDYVRDTAYMGAVIGRHANRIAGGRITVATKYPAIAREFFARKGVHVDLIKLYGSMELAPLTGLAQAIVDLVSSGQTLKANRLVEVERVMDVSSRLVVNQAALKLHTAPLRRIIDAFAQAVHEQA